LTLKLLNTGHKVLTDDRAISFEEVPESIKDFTKQRHRWFYGILQSLWKNRRNIMKSTNKPLKYFTVPFMLFSYILYLTAPLIDVLFILAVLSGSKFLYIYVLIFYLSDLIPS